MTIKEIVSATGLTQKQVAEILGCSYRTVQEWVGERRKCPEWVKKLIIYYLDREDKIMKYVVRDREAGNIIEYFATADEAKKALLEYEAEDMREGTYTEDFYEVYNIVDGMTID